MSKEILENLIQDADLVADVGVRLGRLKDAGLLTALGNARQALASNTISPDVLVALQKALNGAMVDISPITLNDLRRGWRPYGVGHQHRLGTVLFFIFSLLLIASTAYTTQIYERGRSLYATTLELQDARGAEQAMRLFGMLKRNQQDVAESLITGKKEFLYEVFSKALFDLELMNLKFQAYSPIASDVLRELDVFGRARAAVTPSYNAANPANVPIVEQYLENYKRPSAELYKDLQSSLQAPSTPSPSLKGLDVQALLNIYIDQLKAFNTSIKVGFDPLAPNDYFEYLFRLQDGISFIGSWVLPALYGMLGAVIFHMRRLLDPAVPNPSWLRATFRVVLGAFAGIIIVWFWTPSSQKLAQAEFATLTSFGVAFLFGFSTDVFFQALDRFVSYLSQAVGSNAS